MKATGSIFSIATEKEMKLRPISCPVLNPVNQETTRKIKSMFTDPQKIRKDDKGHPDGCVVFAFHGIYNRDEVPAVRSECEEGARGCVDCKMQLAEKMNKALEPIRDKRIELESIPEIINEILRAGAEKAQRVARQTLKEVAEVMNLPPKEIF